MKRGMAGGDDEDNVILCGLGKGGIDGIDGLRTCPEVDAAESVVSVDFQNIEMKGT